MLTRHPKPAEPVPFATLGEAPLTPGEKIAAALKTIAELDNYLTPGQRRALAEIAGDLSAPFDLHQEVKAQYALVQALRQNLVNPLTNKLRDGFEVREAREMVTAFTSFLSLYLKAQEKLDKESELSAIEAAFIETVKNLPEEAQEQYITDLERRLRAISI
jgi:hypothetical protein